VPFCAARRVSGSSKLVLFFGCVKKFFRIEKFAKQKNEQSKIFTIAATTVSGSNCTTTTAATSSANDT